ncbi:Gfo/Idh/MocA family protein [Lacimicrobium alkaliphilum]|uniref:Oxidoreductase n=1 Tax=Lacimicrobium alkaliphilum TaxID=1526571 RepID=A0ABQ1RRE7_9ALTE|nr:Gfo/Idh/MocA family oxidoreductase [Lacimicrobium alkaliphilum]GGD78920.1 oxidoreductase [Lacimicrobium alkaliphilum]
MKIALIGLGDIAKKAYLPMIANWPRLELVLCSRNDSTLADLAAQYRISQTCNDYQELPGHGVDAVMIHAATKSHYSLARFFLNLSIPVFVDKPLCDSYTQCEALYDLAEQKSTPLFVGFNRRYLPLLSQETGHSEGRMSLPSELMSLRWEKHRHDLPGEPRNMIFDDFIHVVDSVNVTGELHRAPLQFTVQSDRDKLTRIDCHWQHEGRIYEASMNRQFGTTCERISLNYRNKALELESLLRGHWLEDGQQRVVGLADWTPMLAGKGFYAMLEHWLEVIAKGSLQSCRVERNLSSHRLCEDLCQQLIKV